MILSVIVPVYNGETYLKRCIDSIVTSCDYAFKVTNMPLDTDNVLMGESVNKSVNESIKLDQFEIIIVNDGSTDDTSKVCETIKGERQNIKIITLTDEGVSVARNKGMAAASGEYISFVDADDVVSEDMFRNLMAVANQEDADIVGCGFYEWSDEAQIHSKIDHNLDVSKAVDVENDDASIEYIKTSVTVIDEEILNQNNITANTGINIYNTPVYNVYNKDEFISKELLKGNTRCWSKIYRARLLKDNDIQFEPGLSIGEDMLFLANAVNSCENKDGNNDDGITKNIGNTTGVICELTTYKGYGYYKNPLGAINRPFTKEYMDQIYCWEKLSELLNVTLSSDDTDASGIMLYEYDDIRKILNSRYIVALMLVASKMAVSGQRLVKLLNQGMSDENDADYISIIHDKLIKALKNPYDLDVGYKIKTKIFKISPALYLKLYGSWKK